MKETNPQKISIGTYVRCLESLSPILEKDHNYTVIGETEHGFLLLEVDPPKPHTSFHKSRFVVTEQFNDSFLFHGREDLFWKEFNESSYMQLYENKETEEPEFLEKLYN